jgi:hypothetical protein
LKAVAIEEWKLEQGIARRLKEESLRKDKEFRKRLGDEFGYSEEEIETILKKKEVQDKNFQMTEEAKGQGEGKLHAEGS